MLYIVSCLVILPLFVVPFLKQIVAISTLRNSLITSFSLLTNLAAYFIDCIRSNTTAISTAFRRHSWYLKPFSNEWKSLSLIWNPLKNDSNIDKERRESTTIYFTSIRQSDECVGGIEWTELMRCSMRLRSLEKRSLLSWRFFLFVLARDRSRIFFFTRARDIVRWIF
jgi:hypothetical protein